MYNVDSARKLTIWRQLAAIWSLYKETCPFFDCGIVRSILLDVTFFVTFFLWHWKCWHWCCILCCIVYKFFAMIKNTHKTLNFLWLLTSVFVATLNAALFVRVEVIFIVTFCNYHIKCNKKWYSGLTGDTCRTTGSAREKIRFWLDVFLGENPTK